MVISFQDGVNEDGCMEEEMITFFHEDRVDKNGRMEEMINSFKKDGVGTTRKLWTLIGCDTDL